MVFEFDLFKYCEKIIECGNLPSYLSISDTTLIEVVLFRLFIGTISISNTVDDIIIEPNKNYAYLGMKDIEQVDYSSLVDCTISEEIINNGLHQYFLDNRSNNSITKNLLLEFSHFLYHKNKQSHTSAFVHLYRALEYMSFSFPVIYFANAQSHKGAFKDIKKFFSEDKDASELNFFKKFQNSIIGTDELDVRFRLNFPSTPEMNMIFNKIILDLGKQKLDIIDEGGTLSISYKFLFDLIISIRNSFFHNLYGIGKNNIEINGVFMDYFFECINEHLANWIVFVYFSIMRKRLN